MPAGDLDRVEMKKDLAAMQGKRAFSVNLTVRLALLSDMLLSDARLRNSLNDLHRGVYKLVQDKLRFEQMNA